MLPDPLGDYLDALAQAGFMTEDPGIEPDAEAAAPALDALLGSEISIPDELIGAVGVHVGMLDGKLEGSDTPEIERSIARLSKVCEYSAVRAEPRRFPTEQSLREARLGGAPRRRLGTH